MSRRLYLPASFDPRAIQTAGPAIDDDPTLAKARLEALTRVLLGQQLYISEGWSLDSRTFLRLVNDMLTAATRCGRKREFLQTTPVLIEKRSTEDNFLAIWLKYLRRDGCLWAGIPGLQDDVEGRRKLVEQLTVLSRTREELGSSVADRAVEYLEGSIGKHISADCLHSFAEYAMDAKEEARRYRYNSISSTATFEGMSAKLSGLEKVVRLTHGDDPADSLLLLVHRMQLELEDFSSSRLLKVAKDSAEEEVVQCVEYLIRIQAMEVTLGHTGEFSSPILYDESPPLLATAMRFAPSVCSLDDRGFLEYQQLSFRKDDPLIASLVSTRTDWIGVWEQVIQLVLRPDWKEAVAAFKGASAQAGLDGFVNLAEFEAMERLVASNCPSLVLSLTGGGRLNLGLRRKPRDAEAAADYAVQAAVEDSAKEPVRAAVAAGLGAIGMSAAAPVLTAGGTIAATAVAVGLFTFAKRRLSAASTRQQTILGAAAGLSARPFARKS